MENEYDPRYQEGKIYKIVCNITNEIYYGSTKNTLEKRLQKHLEKTHLCMSKQILDRGDYEMILIKDYPCNNRRELELEEGKYMRENECINIKIPGRTKKEYYEEHKEKLSLQMKQYREEHKKEISEKSKEHYEKNKDKIKQKVKEYRKEHREHLNKKSNEYRKKKREELNKKQNEKRKENKEEINKKQKEDRKNNFEKYKNYDKNKYEKNKEKILERAKEKITCECGAIVRRGGIAEHKKSLKHLKLTECIIID